MDRKTLEEKGLTAEQVEFVIAENGKDIQREQKKNSREVTPNKQLEAIQNQLEEAEKQVKEYEEKLKAVKGLDEESKSQIENLRKEYEEKAKEQEKKVREIQKQSELEVAKLRRETETKEFFAGLGKKFVTPETAKAFESRLNEALADKTNEGKNRKDLFESLIKDGEGKERSDIFAVEGTSKPAVVGGSGPSPGEEKSPPKTIPTII